MSIIQGNAHTSAGGYQIERSLRFNSADSAYLNRTPASVGTDRTKWTFSAWIKRSALSGTVETIFSAGTTSSDYSWLRFDTDNTLSIFNATSGVTRCSLNTLALFRDVSAYYHIVFNRNGSSGAKTYVNGIEQSITGTNYSGTTIDFFADTVAGSIGRLQRTGTLYLNGYMTEVNFIDGQALTPSDFGETDSNTGVWKPKAFSGTYGTNGFYLKFADNSNTTAATLGKDSSGNGNNWTPNNFSVTAGAGNDSLVDSPTSYGTDAGVGGTVRGNYCTLNPLDVSANTLSNGNLDITYATNSDTNRGGTIAVSTGKWYFEATVQAVGGTYAIIGVTSGVATATPLGTSAYQYSYISSTGNKFNNNSSTAYGNTYTTGDVIGVALDMDNGKVWFSKNGTFQASGDPAAGTNQAFSGLSGSFSPAINARNNSIVNLNCGQRAFAYTAPSGFKALCTTNLPTPTIGATSTTQANDYMNVVLYTGTGSSLGVTGVGFQPDWTWIKGRSGATDHGLYDAVRGVQKQLESNTTTAETTETTGLTAFGADGFTVGALAQLNTSSATYVAWNWKANGAGSSNTAGTITSTVSANTTSGFSIVTWTGTGANATVGHGLGVAPSMVIVKNRDDGAQVWVVWFTGFGSTEYIVLNDTAAKTTSAGVWNSTVPTSTVFSVGTANSTNKSTNKIVAYCFAAVAGYSAFGSYTGNGAADGPFVFTNFRPRYVLIKRSAGDIGNWVEHDTARESYNLATTSLYPNLSNAETVAASQSIDILSNGFKLRNTSGDINASGGTYIYMALAENPFKYSLGR
jgi:hypothetical protein